MNTNNLPLVSIIIPFYNHNHFIKQTLDSIVADTYENKEIIIINDGSPNPDDSNIVNWISEHKDVSINYIKRENRGVSKTLNELIRLSTGKYIVVCASDDYLINNTIANRVKVLEDTTDKLLLISDNIVVDDNGNKIYNSNIFEYRKGKLDGYLDNDKLKKTIITKWALAGACYIADRKIFDNVGFYNEEIIIEDWDFFLRVVASDLALFYSEKVSAYRLHDTNSIKTLDLMNMHVTQALVAKNSIKLFSYPFNLFMIRRWYKYVIRIRKLNKNFPYNLSIYKKHKKNKN